jgi:hypothetical protein
MSNIESSIFNVQVSEEQLDGIRVPRKSLLASVSSGREKFDRKWTRINANRAEFGLGLGALISYSCLIKSRRVRSD